MKLNLFHVMLVVVVLSVSGISAVSYLFFSSHPYFSPFTAQSLDEGWIDGRTYVSENIGISVPWAKAEQIQFAGDGIIPVVNMKVSPVRVIREGVIELRINGVYLGMMYINSSKAIDSAVSSCCSYPLIVGGEENIIEFKSTGFTGIFQYTITIPGR